jgi:hypothetical protein
LTAERVFLAIWAAAMLLTWPPWFWWVVRSRRIGGHQILPKIPPQAIFAEKRASGGELGKLGGAANCLLVVVTPDELLVTPSFPFDLIAPPRGPIGLVHKVARTKVRASKHQSWRGNVRVEICGATHAVLDLKLREPERFLEALRPPESRR